MFKAITTMDPNSRIHGQKDFWNEHLSITHTRTHKKKERKANDGEARHVIGETSVMDVK